MSTIPAEPFCYEVLDLETRKHLGAGKDPTPADHEQLFVKAHETWTKHYPHRQIHVEQISYDEYERALGREPDWCRESEVLLLEDPLSFLL